MTDTTTPEQWALDEAHRRSQGYNSRMELARMIQTYQPELKPKDPDEAIAAEACAQIADADGPNWKLVAANYRAGMYRDNITFEAALRAIKLYKESVS